MSRVREFDPEQALADAMQVFWRSGYANTSMEDIVSETGVSRYGLYGTFGNKKDLLVAAMRHYEKSMTELLWPDLRKPDAGRAEIIEFWRAGRKHAEDEGFCNGCLIVNIAAEVAPHEPEIAAEVQRIDNEYAAVFAAAIASILLVLLTVVIHYEILRLTSDALPRGSRSRRVFASSS